MFPTFISILDIQSWWEVPSIAHFCSLFRSAFNLLDFDIEDLEEALLTDGTEETSWLQELIVRLLSGCLPNNEISTFNYQMFLRRLFRQKCQEHDIYNPFNTDIDFQLLPLRTKVDILQCLCDFRLDADDVLDQLKNLEADSLRVVPLGYDSNDSAYWYFYGTRLYREDFKTKNNKKKSVWQVICFSEDDWFQLTKKFKKSTSKAERQLHNTLSENFLPELPRLFKEKERLARKRLLESQPRRTSSRLRKENEADDKEEKAALAPIKEVSEEEERKKKRDLDKKRREEAYERRAKLKEQSEDSQSEVSESRYEMAGAAKNKKSKARQRRSSTGSNSSKDAVAPNKPNKKSRKSDKEGMPAKTVAKPATVGRQTNNSLSAATGQIVIQPVSNPNKKKLKTSQVFRQTEEDLQVGMHKILDFVKNHEDAWPFADPVEEEYAPNYYSIIRKPMDLQKMEERLDSGFYKSYSKFKTDFQLIVNNCRLYNGAENEYTEMVDNLLKVFETATEKYLDQISSSDDEIAVEYLDAEADNKTGKRRKTDDASDVKKSKSKPALAAQPDKKRERSSSQDSIDSKPAKARKIDKPDKKTIKNSKNTEKSLRKSESFESLEDVEDYKPVKSSKKIEKKVEEKPKKSEEKNKKAEEKGKKAEEKGKKAEEKGKKAEEKLKKSEEKTKKSDEKPKKSEEKPKKSEEKPKKSEEKPKKSDEKPKKDLKNCDGKKSGKIKASTKENKEKSGKESKKQEDKNAKDIKKKAKSKKDKKKSPPRSPSRSPPQSNLSSPPPSWPPSSPESRFDFSPKKSGGKRRASSSDESSIKQPKKLLDAGSKHQEKKFKSSPPPSPKPKDKHNKLRETIEKLKAKSEISNKIKASEYDFKDDDVPKPVLKSKVKEKVKVAKKDKNLDADDGAAKKSSVAANNTNSTNKNIEIEALTLATEQTLKDINKWLDDTPKFSEFSSASNSPSYTGLDDFDSLGGKIVDDPNKKKSDKPNVVNKKEGGVSKDGKKRPSFRDPTKLFNKRREIQRTIDRLQPGKSKGNLISNVASVNKVEELFPLGPLSKIKDTKNSLIVKTDTNAPKLSLGSVLDSFGKHKFIDDQKKEEDTKVEVKKVEPTPVLQDSNVNEEKEKKDVKESVEPKEEIIADDSVGGATPNLSAWFKAFGAPKMPAPVKKSELKPDGKENEEKPQQKVPVPDPSPSLDSPQQTGQSIPRQRRISTGSSMSERSSFSQDMDSPRVGIDERLAYPAPYPSPMHRSPSGASPVMASPRPDVSPKSAAYPPFNGQIRVGFYQDTVSTKSSPDKSCSPRDNPQSPYPQYSEHVYTPNTTQNVSYSYSSSPYYSHTPNYSSTNPTPPYNTEPTSSGYYDTSKSLTDPYQAKSVPNYSSNSPASNISSPAQHSPNIHSPKLQIANVQSPSMETYQQEDATPKLPPTAAAVVAEKNLAPQNTMFPVKKRYTEAEQKQFKQYAEPDELINKNLQLGEQLNLGTTNSPSDARLLQTVPDKDASKYVHQNIPEPKPLVLDNYSNKQFSQTQQQITAQQQQQQQDLQQQQQQPDLQQRTYQNPSSNPYYGADSNFSLNIPSARGIANVPPQQNLERKIDLSKYTNMGYSGPDVNFSRNLQQQFHHRTAQQTTESSQSPQANDILRYPNSNNMLSQMSYKSLNAETQQTHGNYVNPGATRGNEPAARTQQDVSIPKPTYNAPTIGGNIANLSHIVDRYGNDERMISGLQSSTPSYYSDKGLTSTHMFNKSIPTTGSALPMFSQANIPNIQPQYQSMQAPSSSMYNRQMNELQNPNMMSVEAKAQNLASSVVGQAKKTKKPKFRKTATPTLTSDQPQQTASNQGFQSYAGLKAGNTSIEPSAISLKSSSVVSGSAFSFGPSATGLGIGSGLYGAPDKDSYPNFLDEFGRSAPNYYMAAAAAAHHRSTPEANDKQTRAHQSTSAQSAAYPYLGAPQVRPPSYPIGAPFIPPAQAQLMDTSSPIYQHYLQAGLNQGLLGPPGTYPPGFHAALSMRQPYDAMTRPSWL